jgi:hypothetical protein
MLMSRNCLFVASAALLAVLGCSIGALPPPVDTLSGQG